MGVRVSSSHGVSVAPSSSVLEPASIGSGGFSQKPPLQPRCYQNLALQTQYTPVNLNDSQELLAIPRNGSGWLRVPVLKKIYKCSLCVHGYECC